MFTDIRLLSQQLARPQYDSPRELVARMGAIQAQDYRMAKWAVGIRLRRGSIGAVDGALARGEILRTHVMRPTWHFVAAEDIRWMVKLSAKRVRMANESSGRSHKLGFTEETYLRGNRQVEKMLEGNKSLTREEIRTELERAGLPSDTAAVRRFLIRAETDGLVCSGPDRGAKPTYALLEERVPPVPEITQEEALARLARSYFRSHAPATLADFAWWSGLGLTEAREAVALIGQELVREGEWLVHDSCRDSPAGEVLHLLPSYDEYLIAYKDRTGVLAREHQTRAFSNNGIFQLVVLHNGHIRGNWGRSGADISFFEPEGEVPVGLLDNAINHYRTFHTKKP